MSDTTFVTRFRVDCHSKADVLKWVADFSDITKTTFRVSDTFPENSERLVYKVVFSHSVLLWIIFISVSRSPYAVTVIPLIRN